MLILMFYFFLFSIHDNEGAAEMLIDTIGPGIVNAADTKNRYAINHLALALQFCAGNVHFCIN